MSSSTIPFHQLVRVDAGLKPSVQLPVDFEQEQINARLVRSYIPTGFTINLFWQLARSCHPNSNERAHTLVGTYGTGKSDLLLMIGNYFARSVDDPLMQPFYDKLRYLDPERYKTIYESRAHRPPYLVVMLQADATTPFSGFVLHGLEQALRYVGVGDLMLETKYRAAREKITEWRQEKHPRLADLRQHLQHREGKELEQLERELDSAQADLAFAVFARSFNEVTGANFNIYGYSQPYQTYIQVSEELCKRGTHSGIVVICDEFTEFLRRFEQAIDQQSADIDAETKAVDNLAERSASSGAHQLHFIVASLESFASASSGSGTQQAARSLERIGGRFRHHTLNTEGSEELIRGAIQVQPSPEQITLLPNAQYDELLDVAYSIWKHQKRQREWVRDVIVKGTFPLHPLTTYALPLLNERVAQSQRTMFQFLKDEQLGLQYFLNNAQLTSPYPNWHTLLTLDLLFDYFEESIKTKMPDLEEAYERAHQMLRGATVDTTLALRVLKFVTICEVLNDTHLRPTHQFIRLALNLPPTVQAAEELKAALYILEEQDALYPPSDESFSQGIYSLPMIGRVSTRSLRQQIKKIATQRQTNVRLLESRYPPDPVKADEYNRHRGTHRQFTARYVDVSGLQHLVRLADELNNVDGIILYVVASDDGERASAQSKARELTEQYENLVVAVPNTPSGVLRALTDYSALEELRRSSELEPGALEYLSDQGKIGKEYKQRLTRELDGLKSGRDWEWFVRGNPIMGGVATPQQRGKVINQLVEQRFPRTPRQSLAQHFKPDTITPTLEKAVTELLKGTLKIGSSSKGQLETTLSRGIVELGLLTEQQKAGGFVEYVITEPDLKTYESHMVWKEFREYLEKKEKHNWQRLVDALRKPPYGLYDSLLIVYLAAFLVHHAESVEVVLAATTSGGRTSVGAWDAKLLRAMVEQPKNYSVRFQPLTDGERRWLRGLVSWDSRRTFSYTPSQGTTLRGSVAEHLHGWLKRLDLPAFAIKLTVEDLQQSAPSFAGIAFSVAQTLLTGRDDKPALMSHIMDTIPNQLGAPRDRSKWDEATVNDLVARFSEVCRFLEKLPALLEQQTIARVIAVFGVDDVTANEAWQQIFRWRHSRQSIVPETLNTQVRTFFRLTYNATGNVKEALLQEFARQIVGIGTDYKNWSEPDRIDKLVQAVTSAKRDIDAKWEATAPVETVWLNGLAAAALGREESNVQIPTAATRLAEWFASYPLPACAASLTYSHIQLLFPSENPETVADLVYLLQRSSYSSTQWESAINGELAQHFGIRQWYKDEVQRALRRMQQAMQRVRSLDDQMQHHLLGAIAAIVTAEAQFPNKQMLSAGLAPLIEAWLAEHPLPEQPDLSQHALIVLEHLRANIDHLETTLLIALPRALPTIEQSYQQWSTYDRYEVYLRIIEDAVREIDEYTPTPEPIYKWLIGIIEQGIQQVLRQRTRDQKQLIAAVEQQFAQWLGALDLPAFSTTLSHDDFQSLFPDSSAPLQASAKLCIAAAFQRQPVDEVFLLQQLPQTVAGVSFSELTERSDVGSALTVFAETCALLLQLKDKLEQHVVAELGSVVDIHVHAPEQLISHLRSRRNQYVILNERLLSPDAQAVLKVIQATTAEPTALLLERLPRELREVRASYGEWTSWQTRSGFIDAFGAAIQEIEEKGKIIDPTERVKSIWKRLKQEFVELSEDEQRWFIKQFSEEYQR